MIQLSKLVIPANMCNNINYDALCLTGGASINGWSKSDIVTTTFETHNLADFVSKSCFVNSLPNVTSICSKPSFFSVQNTTETDVKLFKEKSLLIVIALLDIFFMGFISLKLRFLIKRESEYDMH
jgi:hypothetical protein